MTFNRTSNRNRTRNRLLGNLLAASCVVASVAPSVQAIPFGADQRVTTISGISLAPRITTSNNGTLHLVWMEQNGKFQVYYTRSTTNGSSWEAPRQLTSFAAEDANWPTVAAFGNNVAISFNGDAVSGDTYIVRSADNGANFTAPVNLSNATGASNNPSTLYDTSGRLHVAWWDIRGGAGSLYYRLSCDSGATFGPENNVTSLAIDGDVDSESPRLVEGPNGIVYMAYRGTLDGRPQGGWAPFGGYLRRTLSSDCGTRQTTWLSPPMRLTPPLPSGLVPVHALGLGGSNGKLHLGYWTTATGNDAFYRRGDMAGAGFGPAVNLSNFGPRHGQHFGLTESVASPAIVEDSQNRIHAFYQQNDEIYQSFQVGRLWYRESTNGGASFSAPQQLTTGTRTETPHAVVNNGRVHVVWADYRDNNSGPEIYHKFAETNVVDLITDSDGDGIPNALEGAAGRNPGIKDNDIFGNAGLFARQQYRDFLGREGDQSGLDFWTNAINSSQQTRTAMVNGFVDSPEFQARVAPVTRLYFAYFRRVPDTSGLNFWISRRAAGDSLDSISQAFAASPEFVNTYGALSNTQFINLVYQNLFARAPDAGGFNFWLGQLNNGTSRGSMMTSFSESPEGIAVFRTSVSVTSYYLGLLKRAPDQGGFDFWKVRLDSPDNLIRGFLRSPEYYGRFCTGSTCTTNININ